MNKEVTLQQLNDKLDRIAKISLIGAKDVLDLDETSMFTGFSIGHLYRLTSGRLIPHFKKSRKLYFKKSDLISWMLEQKICTVTEIEKQAETYTATHHKSI